MFVCPVCGASFDRAGALCARDERFAVRREDREAAPDDGNLGRLFAGRFLVMARIGTGSMGTVYRAEQPSVGRNVALKILKGDLSRDPEIVTRFEREAKATGALRSPHSVTVYDHGRTDDGQLFIAMELLEGELLTAALAREGALPVPRTVSLLSQVLRSLAEAHGGGIVHRDLKPDNIFLAQVAGSEVVKIVDFGIAKIVHGDRKVDALETQAGTVWGTPAYMSPEQAQSRALDHRSDLYAAGVIGYQMLTGAPPFQDDDAVVVMARHIKARPRPPSETRPDLPIPASLEGVLMRAMEKDPAARQQSAAAFIAELEACASDVTAAREGRAPNAYLARRRRRLVAAVTVALTVGAGATVVAMVAGGGGSESAAAPALPETAHPAPAEPETPRPAGPTPASLVTIHTTSEPPGAEVIVDGTVVATTPGGFTLPRGTDPVDVIFRRRGRMPGVERVVPDSDRTIDVALGPIRPPTLPQKQPPPSAPTSAPGTSAPYQRFD